MNSLTKTKFEIEDWIMFFPVGKTPRDIQIQAINNILTDFYINNKKYVILEAPVGTGKSFIATTISEYIKHNLNKKTYIVTPQIILQEQYVNEFKYYGNICSAKHYDCINSEYMNCENMRLLHKLNNSPKCNSCPYEYAKKTFVDSPISITNTSYIISNIASDTNVITDREFIAIDEAHNLEQDIISHKELVLEYDYLFSNYNYRSKDWPTNNTNIIKWLSETFIEWIASNLKRLTIALADKNKSHNIVSTAKKISYLTNLFNKVNDIVNMFNSVKPEFIYDNWVIDNNSFNKVIKITPIYANRYTKQLLFNYSNKVLLMSGTILNNEYFCNTLGIEFNNSSFIRLDSPFDVNKRLIYNFNISSMSKKNYEESLPKIVIAIEELLKIHSNDKGIIHVSSHKMATDIYNMINDKRLIIVDDFNKNRKEMIEFHYAAETVNSVLISPSLLEGIDLKDNLSRFQIIAKIPFLNLGDNYIREKKDRINHWYTMQTIKSLVQSYGRSIRNDNDYANTYILDSDFTWFLTQNVDFFPKFFLEAIRLSSSN